MFSIILLSLSKDKLILSDLELPVVELPPRRVVVSEVTLHPDACSLQGTLVLGTLGQESLLILL